MAGPQNPSPERIPVLSYSGVGLDVLFWEKVTTEFQRTHDTAIDEPHWNPSRFPNHKLVFKAPLDGGGQWWRYYYAADRENQDDYNFLADGDTLVRFYIVRRDKYFQRTAEEAAAASPVVENEFTVPLIFDEDDEYIRDIRFSKYVFADDTMVELPEELRMTYVGIQRRYVDPIQVDEQYDDNLERNVEIRTELIAKDTPTGTGSPGVKVERKEGNVFHDFRVTSTVMLNDGETYPYALSTLIGDVQYRFPPLMKRARWIAAWALADSTEAALSYDEAWYLYDEIIDPVIGPYEAKYLRFVTDDPNALRSSYPLDKFVTRREMIGIARAWAVGSTKGNSSFADARPLEVPACIHGDIDIENGDTLSVGQSTNHLPATPNFSAITGKSTIIIGYEPKQGPNGLFIVEITILNATGVYGGVTIPFGTQAAPGAFDPDMGAGIPSDPDETPTPPAGAFSADNTVITGYTSPSAEVRATVGTNVVGRGVANTDGSFTVVMNPDSIYDDAVAVTVRSYVNGLQSLSTVITSNDLSPLRPSGYITSSMTSVIGKAAAGDTISILRNANYQVETVTVPSTRKQKVTLAVAVTTVTAGDAIMEITWVGFNGSLPYPVQFPVAGGESADDLAELARDAAEADGTLTAFFAVSGTDEFIVLEVITAAANDPSATATMNNFTSSGITYSSSTITTTGSTALTIISGGTIFARVTSGLTTPSTVTTVEVQVTTGDDASDMAGKIQAAVAASSVNTNYNPGYSGDDVFLVARNLAPNDPVLAIALLAGTATGFVPTETSVDTTPGGTADTVTVSSTGDYSYAFPSALSDGDIVAITASDAGGVSPALVLEADPAPPTVGTPVVTDSDTITGTGATAGAKILVFDGNDEIGDGAIVAGGGGYTCNLDYKLIRGETVQIVASVNGNEDVRSQPAFLTFSDLNLEVPSFTKTSAGYVGDTPTGATHIVIRKVDGGTETFANLITSNGTFVFNLPDSPPGEAFEVFARYAAGDSDVVYLSYPYIAVRAPIISLGLGAVTTQWGTEVPNGWTKDDPYFYKMEVALMDWVDGMDMTISFPGSDVADIVLSNLPDNTVVYTPYNHTATTATIDPGLAVGNYAHYVKTIPLDTSGSYPVPYPVVLCRVTYPNGQVSSTMFDRNTYRNVYWKDGAWDFQIYLSPYRINEWNRYNYLG